MRPFIQQIMRSVLALLMLAGLVLHPALTQPVYASDIPNDFCIDKEGGTYPHPTDCTKYVACTDQRIPYEMVCSRGAGSPLHYVQDSGPNPAKSHCDYPEVAGCNLDAVDSAEEPSE